MPYQREISRDNKACILFLLDQSYSMVEPLGGSSHRKCDELAQAVNAWLYNMSIRASGNEGVRDYMDVGVIGYRTDQQANPIIGPALVGPLAGRELVSITDIGNYPARIDSVVQRIQDEETGELIEFPSESPIWIDPVAGAVVALLVLKTGIGILRESSADLMDTVPGEALEKQIASITSAIPEVQQIENIEAHRFGPYLVVNVSVGVDGAMSVAEGDRVADRIEDELQSRVEFLRRVYVHYHPSRARVPADIRV